MNIPQKFRESKRRVSPPPNDAPGGGSDPSGAPATPSAAKPRKPELNRKDRKPWTRRDEDALIAAFTEAGFHPAALRKALKGACADRTDHALRTKLGTLGYRGPKRQAREKATASSAPILTPPQPNDPGGSAWKRRDAEFVRMVIREGRRLGLC